MAVPYDRVSRFLTRLAYHLKSGAELRKALELDPDRRCSGRAAIAAANGQSVEAIVARFPLSSAEKSLLSVSFRYADMDAALDWLSSLYLQKLQRVRRFLVAYTYPFFVLGFGCGLHAVQIALFGQATIREATIQGASWLGATVLGYLALRFILQHRILGFSELIHWLPMGRECRLARKLRFYRTLHAALESGAAFDVALLAAAKAEGSSASIKRARRAIASVGAGIQLNDAIRHLGALAHELEWTRTARDLAHAANEKRIALEVYVAPRRSEPSKAQRAFALFTLLPAIFFVISRMINSTAERLGSQFQL